MPTVRKRKFKKTSSETFINRNRGRELPEDIMADAANTIFIPPSETKFYRRKRFNFIIGLSLGLLLAMFAATTTPAVEQTQNLLTSVQDYLMLQLADIDLANLLPQSELVDEFLSNFTQIIKPIPATEISFMPALEYKDELNLKPHFPVVMIPGIISTGLESWSTDKVSRKYFRKRMWGSMSMVRSVLLDKEDWTNNIMLDPVTGLDPPHRKIRAVQGVEAADYFITGYWVWAKIIENLATIGYDTNTMHFASYDWRLAFGNLEVRDYYFSQLKAKIELSKQFTGLGSVIITHSMGGSMFPYFLKWVESDQGGKGGPNWVNDHIESFVNIAGPLMGVPKAVTSLLSGETHDTMALGSSMLPKGGTTIWGNSTSAPDDQIDEKYESFGNMISFVPRPEGINENTTDTPDNANFKKQLYANYSFGITTDEAQLLENDEDPRKCYYYAVADESVEEDCLHHNSTVNGCSHEEKFEHNITNAFENRADDSLPIKAVPTELKTPRLYIDASVSDPVQRIETGIRFSDGDGTVPLLSLGYMCAPSGGWTKHANLYNPGRSPVVLREYDNKISPSKLDVRGGYKSGNHVDILGNWEMTLDILQIVSGSGANITQRIYSSIEEYAKKIQLPSSSA
ncbi:Lecithin:cholesterol acyltransferase-domain-containing protein [Cokeromyces recurvatus]|uniref:Lecithin:cholesterol acyltransferase-domain-containing protein n=1 Tax=Cokeromyces recurvatus TaxID=90255 RepID=UPI00221E5AB1|nr:Lecithin:cholesterol acyltransferase-domain-containing protein [Cokeromyces recurvatus]KAI7899151.1 Lecithin:cholesterol acyltransferase-domain-containing protein [Cokeromyces recurvatus]